MKFPFKFLIFSFLPFLLSAYEYDLCIGAMFRNEARWMKEWIEYHRLIGVQHFYLYDNDSEDNFLDVLAPYIQQGIVELIPWKRGQVPFTDRPGEPDWYGYQGTAYENCIKRCMHKTTWLAIIDLDEFIVPEHGIDHFQNFLKKEAKTKVGSYNFFWKCFGTSNHFDIPTDGLVTERLVMRALDHHSCNSLSKAFYRPEAVTSVWIHGGELHPHYKKAAGSEVRINHYQFRGRKEAFRKRWGFPSITSEDMVTPVILELIKEAEGAFNGVEDRTIQAYVPALKRAMHGAR